VRPRRCEAVRRLTGEPVNRSRLELKSTAKFNTAFYINIIFLISLILSITNKDNGDIIKKAKHIMKKSNREGENICVLSSESSS
jgi:hypothetical protein